MRELYATWRIYSCYQVTMNYSPMTILEAASCEAPIMLRDLDLYKVILDGNYRATSDVSEMREAILEYKNDPEALKGLGKEKLARSPKRVL